MANNQIIISRIQHRRGRRENLPQPLLPGELALTADTGQVWVGQDPDLAPSSVNVYSDKADVTAQTIVDTNIVEAEFDASFTSVNFTTLRSELVLDGTVTLTNEDILYDDTYRGTIKTLAASGGSGYTTGDVVTAISSTGSGFVGTATAAAGALTGVTITSGGQNYDATTTFTVANGTGGTVTITNADIHGTTVHIAARPTVDPNNTIANISTALNNTSLNAKLIASGAYGGTFLSGTRSANNHVEAANVVDLINKVNSESPSQTTGLVYTNLNLEITSQRVFPFITGFYFEGLETVNDALKVTFLPTQEIYFENDSLSRAYATVPSSSQQIYDIQKNGVSVGSITFESGVNIGTVAFTSTTTFTATDRLEIYTPSAVDGTINQVAITLNGYIVLN